MCSSKDTGINRISRIRLKPACFGIANLQVKLEAIQQEMAFYAENDVPHPQPPLALGFSNVKPEPITFEV